MIHPPADSHRPSRRFPEMRAFAAGAIVVATLAFQNGAFAMSQSGNIGLDGNWIVTEAEEIEMPSGAEWRLEITGDSVFGIAPCNPFRASLSRQGDQFVLGPIALEPHLCDADVMAMEQDYIGLLGAVSSYAIAGDELTLRSFGDVVVRATREK